MAYGIVTTQGKILWEAKEPTQLSDGWQGLKNQLIHSIEKCLSRSPNAKAIGIAAAGPLHGPQGLLLDPTNFGWKLKKPVSLTLEISRYFGLPTVLENDAAAAVLAESWLAKAPKDTVILTLGTGLGIGVLLHGKLHRGGQDLHPEGSHFFLRYNDRTAPCGCGNYGCAEAFLSGEGFLRRARKIANLPKLDGRNLLKTAKKNKKIAGLLEEYSELLAAYIQSIVVLYYPKRVILTGSFSLDHQLFLPAARKHLKVLLGRRLNTIALMPEIQISKLQNKAGLLGAAYIAKEFTQN